MTPKAHLHLKVADLGKSRRFYESFFGGAPVKLKQGYVKFLPAFAPLNVALMEEPGRKRGTVDHVGIQVGTRKEVQKHLARVKAAGLPVREEINTDC